MTRQRNLTVAIFGSSTASSDSPCCRLAAELAAGLAVRGVVVKNGGYDGVMAAASRAAREAGGQVIGVTVAPLDQVRRPNPWLTEVWAEPDLMTRLRRLVEETDIYYAIEQGGPGTLNEVFLVWAMMVIGELPRRPLVLVGSGWPELLSCLALHFGLTPEAREIVRLAPDVAAALATADDWLAAER